MLVDHTSFIDWGEPPLQVADCSTTGRDLEFHGHLAHVLCPKDCNVSRQAQVVGASIHPKLSTVCNAAIVDGVLPTAGGKLIVTETQGLASYSGVENGPSASEPGANIQDSAFHMYSSDNINHTANDLRLINRDGFLSSQGRLELRTSQGWGTVCGLNYHAAKAACQQLGFEYGYALPFANCSKEHNCGAPFSTVAAKDIECPENAGSVAHCPQKAVDKICQSHKFDAIVKCSHRDPRNPFEKGTVRLVNGTKEAMSSGVLEMYDGYEWQPVSREGFTPADAMVACRQMGFEGVKLHEIPPLCEEYKGMNQCGLVPPRIEYVHCNGTEKSILACSYNYRKDKLKPLLPSMNAIVECAGKGNPTGKPLEDPVPIESAPFRMLHLSCGSTLKTTHLDKSAAGTMVLATCPARCTKRPLEGSVVYTAKTPICTAAVHAGVTGAAGGVVVVEVGHGQELYFGSHKFGMTSDSALGAAKSFLVSIPTTKVLAQAAIRPTHNYAGISGPLVGMQ